MTREEWKEKRRRAGASAAPLRLVDDRAHGRDWLECGHDLATVIAAPFAPKRRRCILCAAVAQAWPVWPAR